MKVTIVYDNEAYKKELESDWGFSCLVEMDNTPTLLFDTGTNGDILLRNMKKLKIDPDSIEEIFISHAHTDHTGGLESFLKVNNNVKVYVPRSFRASLDAREVVSVTEAIQIHRNVFSTGELARIEQSLVVRTEKGLVVIDGCSHPGVGLILQAASRFGKIYGLIGGLHGFDEFDCIKDLGLICATHCTQHIPEIKALYPDTFVSGGAGRVITV